MANPSDFRNTDFSRGVPFTQYLRPSGEPDYQWIAGLGADVVAKAERIVAAGYGFACEVLPTNEISLTIGDADGDYAVQVVPNGPQVPEAVAKLILTFPL